MKKWNVIKVFLNNVAGISQKAYNHFCTVVGLISSIIGILQFMGINSLSHVKINTFVQQHSATIKAIMISLWIVFAVALILKYRSAAIRIMNVSSIEFAEVIEDSTNALVEISSINEKEDVRLFNEDKDEGFLRKFYKNSKDEQKSKLYEEHVKIVNSVIRCQVQ